MAAPKSAGPRRGNQTIMIVTCCAAVILLQMWLNGTLGLHPLVAGAITLAIVAVFVLFGWLANRMGASAREQMEMREIEPFLSEYAQGHSKKQLIRDYEEWASQPHVITARVEFLKRMMLALADDGHNFEALSRTKELEALCRTDADREATKAFLAELDERVAASKARKAEAVDAESTGAGATTEKDERPE